MAAARNRTAPTETLDFSPTALSQPCRRQGRKWPVAFTLVIVVMATWGSAVAWGWGFTGHRIAGQIAADRLNPHARQAIADLLGPKDTLSNASTWADTVRKEHPEAATWHYVNVPITEAKYDLKYEDPKGGVVSKIGEFQKILGDPNAPRLQRQEALKFLIHFVEDMHQPVHVGHRDDRGGNNLQVQFFDKGSNLHRVWDTDLIEHDKHSVPDYVRTLEARISPELATEWTRGTVEDWANESLMIAKKAYLQPGTTTELRPGAKLGQSYYQANLPIAEQRLAQSGVRLASLLNLIFP